MDNVTKLINSLNIPDDEYVIVACSSGPDSMMLLDLLTNMHKKVVCAHVNHHVRIESNQEYVFMEDFCKKNNILFEGYEIENYKNNKFSESEARDKRYKFFDSLVNKYHVKYLFTAHHGDDLMETIMMRLLYGSSIYGYMGFTTITKRNNYEIVRPLIYLTKDEIIKYNKENNIPYNIDNTNETDEHTRNRIRHHILPELKSEVESANLSFLKYNQKIDDLVHYVDRVIMKNYNKVFSEKFINISLFNKLDSYEQKLIIEKIFDINYPDNLYLINDTHTNLIFDLIKSNSNKEINLPANFIARREYDQILFYQNNEFEDYYYVLDSVVKTPMGTIEKVSEVGDSSNNYIYLNSKDIKEPLIVRNRRNGDKMNVKNMNGSKKINDIFIDMKISKDKRDKWPVVLDSNDNILWLPSLKKSDFDIQKNNKYDIILRYQEEEKYEYKNE